MLSIQITRTVPTYQNFGSSPIFEHDICQYVLSYPATIGLAKREVSIARILAIICKPRNSPYTISTVSQTGNMIGCVLDSLDHINRSPIDPETVIEHFST